MTNVLEYAVQLAREAQEAGLIVTRLSPIAFCGACFDVQLWGPDGELWAEGQHESDGDVRRHIAGFLLALGEPVAVAPESERCPCGHLPGHCPGCRASDLAKGAPRRTPHSYTRHGQPCCGDIVRAYITPPVLVTECGWSRVKCSACRADAELIHAGKTTSCPTCYGIGHTPQGEDVAYCGDAWHRPSKGARARSCPTCNAPWRSLAVTPGGTTRCEDPWHDLSQVPDGD